ncbi:MAG TPA: methylated-DNA--[protein]-cysteine S-methyltransferase [Gemmatimonadales bacterium]
MSTSTTFTSPIGELTLTASETGLTGVYFPNARRIKFGRAGENDVLKAAKEQLAEYFAHTRTTFDLPLAAEGTEFEQRVWKLLRAIPYGSTTSYGDLARKLGDLKEARAVGAANGKNPIPIIVPCHRVVGSNGDLTGFGGGLDRKRWLLEHEGALLRLGALCLALLIARPAHAQFPRSQHATVTQQIQATSVSISYNRPVARGRELFGSLVPWGRRWHPGADSATTISFSKDVMIEGHRLAAGRYSLWTIPEEPPKPWTVIFNKGVGGWHTNYPGESQDALRIAVTADSASYVETLTYYFPLVDADSAVLRLQWGTVAVPMKIKVTQ